jgi:PIN domain nuclease of toxin-antitoxin system
VRVLVDTHLLLWAAVTPRSLSNAARELLADPTNHLFFSVVSIWEVAIKRGLDRPDFDVDPRILRREALENGYAELLINIDHAVAIELLPRVHKDPFDRLLVAQAAIEGIMLATADPVIARYPGPVRLV